MNHFDEMTVLLYLEGQLDAERAREVKEHAASCPSCRALLGALESEGIWLRESLSAEDESVPARLVAAPERGAAPWGWLTALGLGAGGAYTLWTGFVEPWQAQAEQAGFHAGKFAHDAFLQRFILERMGRNAKRNGNHGNGHSRTHSDVACAPPLSARDHIRRRDGGCSLRGCASPSRCCCRHGARKPELHARRWASG